ncbi:hypothetical protein KAFR_0E01740 [Kazachstania africana CBS 2517]|uniref:Uncharacterized protein n=1 Tax=Kazachstania africana (strain ATCC 22294 / BCRC 22015 / CBS 2517 / CECT 1963 / NBRC 1671 / NRRL Y-8276) TaxID=1071382 RepID=H2AVC8_KAZAF|nr:hypothetical protein KAFR_0E01740 [Kazachstania africana CBS 2517]CCF58328.1 hypothetical protein KAFR_0E01740 [Kazachstania africana CBS 2517]
MSGILLYEMNHNQYPRCFDLKASRIMVMGDSLSGKTSLILRYVNGSYSEIQQGAYFEDIYSKHINFQALLNYLPQCRPTSASQELRQYLSTCHNDHNIYTKRSPTIDVQILDAAPFEIADFSDLRNEQILQSDAFILCYDPTNRESFLNLRTYQRRIERVRGLDCGIPIIIVSTKSDLLSETKISNDEVFELLSRYELSSEDDFFEISSKDNFNIRELFFDLLIRIEKDKFNQREKITLEQDGLDNSNEKESENPRNPAASRASSTTASSKVTMEDRSSENAEKLSSREKTSTYNPKRTITNSSTRKNMKTGTNSRNLKRDKPQYLENKSTPKQSNANCCTIF